MKKLVLISIALMMFVYVNAADKKDKPVRQTNLTGKICDKNTGETLAGVAIFIEALNKTVYSDLDGNFKVDGMITGSCNLKLSYISYQESVVSNITLEDKETNNIILRLENKK